MQLSGTYFTDLPRSCAPLEGRRGPVAEAFEAKRRAAEHARESLEELFPEAREAGVASFRCKYVDGAGAKHCGVLFVTEAGLRFAGDDSLVRETIPFLSVASVQDLGRPPHIHVFTADRGLHQFTEIEKPASAAQRWPHAAALHCIDTTWRSAVRVPCTAA
ncbi:hypothetical protein DIPPA_22669 [Diplonema papillatum]|nr:hypothetical protein DIPPA_22669 [Diplonema papillatum]